MNALTKLLLARLREPSTWAGAAAVVGSIATAAATRDPNAIGAAVAGVIAMVVPDRKP